MSEKEGKSEVEMGMLVSSGDMEVDEEIVVMPTKVTRTEGLCSGPVAITLVIMSFQWAASSINYQTMNIYLKYIPGSEYLNISIAGISEICAHLSVGLLFLKLGPRLTFVVGYTVSIAGGACLIF